MAANLLRHMTKQSTPGPRRKDFKAKRQIGSIRLSQEETHGHDEQ
jgi:hypothetical protein